MDKHQIPIDKDKTDHYAIAKDPDGDFQQIPAVNGWMIILPGYTVVEVIKILPDGTAVSLPQKHKEI